MVAPAWNCTVEQLRAALGVETPPPDATWCDHVPSKLALNGEDRICECGKTRIPLADMLKCQFVWQFVALVRKAMGFKEVTVGGLTGLAAPSEEGPTVVGVDWGMGSDFAVTGVSATHFMSGVSAKPMPTFPAARPAKPKPVAQPSLPVEVPAGVRKITWDDE